MIELDVQNPYDFESIPTLDNLQRWADSALQKTDQNSSLSLVIRVVNEEEGIDLNRCYRDKDSATNVLSFPYEIPEYAVDIPELQDAYAQQHLGDLVLCEKIVIEEAKAQHKTPEQHWAHLVIHGVLHLQGFDHINDDEATKMEALEIEILESLGFDNPYLDTLDKEKNEST